MGGQYAVTRYTIMPIIAVTAHQPDVTRLTVPARAAVAGVFYDAAVSFVRTRFLPFFPHANAGSFSSGRVFQLASQR